MNQPTVYKNYFENYTSLVADKNIKEVFANQQQTLEDFLNKITEQQAIFSYAPGKWSLKEMLQHIIDTERIFNYRAMCISRKETVTLPGFDENVYAQNSFANERTWLDLSHEMKILRENTILLFNSFTENMLHQTGNFSSANASVQTIGLIIAGHLYHHKNIAEERYLQL